jgi:hypothetical protein
VCLKGQSCTALLWARKFTSISAIHVAHIVNLIHLPGAPNQGRIYWSFVTESIWRFISSKYITYLLAYLFRHLLTYSMEQSPSWEYIRFFASQEIPRILWKPKFHYHFHKYPPPVPIFSQVDPVHYLTSHFLKFNLIISSHLRRGLPSGPFPSGFSTKTLYPLHLTPTFPDNLILDLNTQIR